MKHNIVIFSCLATAFLLYWFVAPQEWTLCVVGLVLVYITLTALGSAKLHWNYFLFSQHKLADTKQVLLTFDDGPDEIYTPIILDILLEQKVRAVFFLIGSKVEQSPHLVKRILNEGHSIGNHTYTHHFYLPWYSTKRLSKDIEKCSTILQQTVGVVPRLFRAPFGVTTPRYKKAIEQHELYSLGWSVRSLDTIAHNDDELLANILMKMNGGDIVLLHDTQAITARVLPELITNIRQRQWILANPENCFEKIYVKD